jgi:hypothetical protein
MFFNRMKVTLITLNEINRITTCTKSKIADYKVPKATEFFTLCPEV